MTKLNQAKEFLFLLLPLAFIIGPFALEFINLLVCLIFLFIVFKKKDFKYFKNKFFLLFISWCLYLLFISSISENILLSLESSLFHFRFILFALALWHTIDNSKNNFLKFFCLSMLGVFVFVQIDSYYQFFFGINLYGYEFDRFTQDRLSGVFGDEWILGSYISRTLPIILSLIIFSFSNSNKFKFFSLVLLISSDILIFLAAERSAFFYLMMSTVLIIILLKSLKFLRVFSFIISLIIILLITFSSNTSKKRIIDKTYDDLVNNDGEIAVFSVQHQVIYETAIKIFNDNKLIGIGPKMFREICKLNKYKSFTKDDGSVDGCQTHPHNTYVQLLAETGIIGFLPVLFLFIYIISLFFKQFYFLYFKKKVYMNDRLILLYIGVFITLWPFIPTGNFFNNYLNFFYFLPVGIIMYDLNKKNEKL